MIWKECLRIISGWGRAPPKMTPGWDIITDHWKVQISMDSTSQTCSTVTIQTAIRELTDTDTQAERSWQCVGPVGNRAVHVLGCILGGPE